MAGYSAEKEKERLKKEKKRHKRGLVIIAVICVLAVIFVSVYGWYLYNNQNYTVFEVKDLIERTDGNSVRYQSFNSGQLLKYSRDGAMALDGDGNILWNGSYEFANPMAATNNSYVAIADIGGMQACIYNGKDSGTMLEVLYPIEQVAVAGQGVVALLVEDGESDVIQIYDPYASGDGLLVEVPTDVQNDGFPTCLALSRDGTKLVTSMIRLSNGVQENYINFYNFSDVGENNINRLVGARSFKDRTVSNVKFLNNDMVCVETEQGFSLYSMKQVPNDIADLTFKENIKSIFSSESYVGVVLETYAEETSYPLYLYDMSGKLIYEQKIGMEYNGVFVSGKEIVFYNNHDFQIRRLNGKKKFEGTLDTGISMIVPVNNFETYLVLDQSTVKQLRLN